MVHTNSSCVRQHPRASRLAEWAPACTHSRRSTSPRPQDASDAAAQLAACNQQLESTKATVQQWQVCLWMHGASYDEGGRWACVCHPGPGLGVLLWLL